MAADRDYRREHSAALTFAGNPLDRLSERRDDNTLLAAAFASPTARAVLMQGDLVLFRQAGAAIDPFFSCAEARAAELLAPAVLLGQDARGPVYAAALTPSHSVDRAGTAMAGLPLPHAETRDLRTLALSGELDQPTLGMFAQAKSILHWHAENGFCPRCGAATAIMAAGWRRDCRACGAHHFPRTDPVAIMLVTNGEHCLLGRQARFAPGMVSALAGFIESGETIEEAVRREVREEAGIAVGRVTYFASQPWPFPASLMIGCFGEALSTTITVDRTELEDARWFSRGEAAQMLAGTHPEGFGAPKPLAIAHHLLKAWVAESR